MNAFANTAKTYSRAALDAIAEALWPTRCAVCDTPGEALCAVCRRDLAYLDWWRACPRCGAPYGRIQCTECGSFAMGKLDRTAPPFRSCASAVLFDDAASRIVTTYKDQGERRLAADLARAIVPVLHPMWLAEDPVLCPVPATTKALRERGFDHIELVVDELAVLTGLKSAHLLARPRSKDQRTLGRASRLANMQGRFSALRGIQAPSHVLLIDDVFTTGATFYAASDALLEAGAESVRCATFARVY